jgi:hypothetical protein
MVMTTLKNLTIVAALLAGGVSLAMAQNGASYSIAIFSAASLASASTFGGGQSG